MTDTGSVSIATFAAWAEPWHQLVVNSIVVSTTLLYLHLAAILVGGGLALAADIAVLHQPTGDGGVRRAATSDDAVTHRQVTQALLVIIGSGFALAAADLVLFWGLPAFWMKMGAFVALLINADVVRRAEHPCHSSRSWTRRRRHAICSVGLWLLTLLGGALLTVG